MIPHTVRFIIAKSHNFFKTELLLVAVVVVFVVVVVILTHMRGHLFLDVREEE